MRMPTFSNSTNILIEASNESNMTRTGFSGHARVGYTPGTPLLYHTSDILESHRHQHISDSYLWYVNKAWMYHKHIADT